MKKIFPILTFILMFFAFLAVQIAQDISTSHANKTTPTQDKKVYYENVFKKMEISLNNKQIKFSELKEDIVVITFWASWCIPCLKEFPSLNKLGKLYKDKIFILGINTDEESPEKKIAKISKKYNLNFPSLVDEKAKYIEKFMVDHIPFTLTFVKGKLTNISDQTHDFLEENYLKEIKDNLNN